MPVLALNIPDYDTRYYTGLAAELIGKANLFGIWLL